jgi:hypothetical protein
MGKAANTGEKPEKVSELTKADAAAYVHDLLDSLQKITVNEELSMLAHLIGLAKMEAMRCRMS